jgi:hypothetical protein
MKHLFLLLSLSTSLYVRSQTISDFETPQLPADSFWNGSDSLINISGLNGVSFSNYYDTAFFYWTGFSLSSTTDTVTGDYTNQYSCISGSGYNASKQYAVFYLSGSVTIQRSEKAEGFYVNNSTYAYRDMQNGSSFSKKFGGLSGNDPDYFVLHITGYINGVQIPDTVSHYLADYRFTDNSLDYIQKEWQWVDLYAAFADADSLSFTLESSDVGSFGMNTPAYFCMDNFTLRDITGVENMNTEKPTLQVYPNPAVDYIYLSMPGKSAKRIELLHSDGRLIQSVTGFSESVHILNTTTLNSGYYLIRIFTEDSVYYSNFLKN